MWGCEYNSHPKLFFSFTEFKGADKRGQVPLNGLLGKIFLKVYTTNYKGFKDIFLHLRGGNWCPQVMYVLAANIVFRIYWTDSLVPIYIFDYDKLYALEVWDFFILDTFRMIKVRDLMSMA